MNEEIYKKLKSLEPFSLSCHHDADGVYSAVLMSRIFKVKEVKCPAFGEYDTDVAVDLGAPVNIDWKGIVIDHHPGHLSDRKYDLIFDYCPTGLVIYNNFRELIKPEDLWLIVGSLVGDGQAELIPDEVWSLYPTLLSGRGMLYKSNFKLGVSSTPAYAFLSSGVNSLCRLGFPMQAYEILSRMKSPEELLDNEAVRNAVDQMRQEEETVYKMKPPVETIGNFLFCKIKTSKPTISLSSLIATKIHAVEYNYTVIVLNEANGAVSIRGVLSKRLANYLNARGFKAGGHAGFCAATVPDERVDEFITLVRRCNIEI